MAVFTASALSMRRKLIIDALREAGAAGPDTAKGLSELRLPNPKAFQEYTDRLAAQGVIRRTPEGKYYLPSSS